MAKTELDLPAVLLASDPESPHIVPVDDSWRWIDLSSLFGVDAKWTKHAEDHLRAIRARENDALQASIERHHEKWRLQTPDPRVYRVRITVEYEELPAEEGRALIARSYEQSKLRK
jgi:hypothetical protein